jgi:anti-sigma B factor antagonist
MKVQAECIVEEDERGVAVVTLSGEHDMVSVDEVRETILSAASDGPVVVNLSQADFIDSSIINSLIRTHEKCDGRLVLEVATSQSVRRILEITGLMRVIPTAEKRDQAVGLALTARDGPADD